MKKFVKLFFKAALIVFSSGSYLTAGAAKADLISEPKKSLPVASNSNAGKRWEFVFHKGVGAEDWIENADDVMCQELRAHMNKVVKKWTYDIKGRPNDSCIGAATLAPMFTQPSWRDLDAGAHELLIAKLIWLSQDFAGYFGLRSDGTQQGFDEDHFRKRAREFIHTGGRLQHLRAKLVDSLYFPYADGDSLSGDLQDVVQLTYSMTSYNKKSERVKSCGQANTPRKSFLVSADLTRPLKNIESWGALLFYRGDPVLAETSLGEEIYIKSPFGSKQQHACRLVYDNR